MSMQLQTQVKVAAQPSCTPLHVGLLQRKCVCGGAPGLTGECDDCRKKRLTSQHRSDDQAEPSTMPSIVQEVLRSPGQPLDPDTRAFMEPRFGHDFSQVRVHTDARAAESAQAVNAQAYTVGREVVFGAGQYRPGTSGGSKLLAHELTHTLQQRGGAGLSALSRLGISTATDPTEKEAEATATAALQGRAHIPKLCAPLRIARQPAAPAPARPAPTVTDPATDAFANEDPALRRRRLGVIRASQNAIEHLRNALSRGYIWDFEEVTARGITANIQGTTIMGEEETLAKREARLRQLMTDLAFMSNELESAPIPYMWTAPDVKYKTAEGGEETMGAVARTEADRPWKDTMNFYAHRGHALGQAPALLYFNWSYIQNAPSPTPAVRRAPASRGVGLGIYIHVPGPKNAPLVYRRLTGYEGWQERGVIMEVWSDDIGYFYHRKGGKLYLPSKP